MIDWVVRRRARRAAYILMFSALAALAAGYPLVAFGVSNLAAIMAVVAEV